ncbi:DNA polymerase I, partial [Candidatus Peregrinibacteria bacterium]|nr:DNA polymerase I [Candidatus Peregrinibacteria bacterium]
RAAEKEGMRVTIVTGDRDAFQLASDNIRIAIPHKGYQQAEYLGPKEVEAKFGIRPDQVPSYKGLSGDSSDNLPGVRGIGPKTAAKLLQDYGTLEGIYENLSKIKPVLREKLERDREQAFFCERMAVLKCDIDLTVSLQELAIRQLDPARISAFFDILDFTLLRRRLSALLATPYGAAHSLALSVAVPEKVEEVKTKEQLSLF